MSTQPTPPSTPVVSPRAALEFLNRAGALLSASLVYEQTLRDVAQLTVPEIADWCAVYVVSDDGEERELTSEHPDPELEALLLEIRRRRREHGGGSESVSVVRSGRSVLATDVRGSPAEEVPAEQRDGLRRLSARSYMIVPLLARGRVIGALTLLSTQAGRHYLVEDLAFAETLAVRCALAIDNAGLYEAAESSRALLDTLFSATPVGLAFFDRQGRYLRINPALAQMNGHSVDEHLGRTSGELLGPLGEEVVRAHARVLSSGRPLLDQEESGEQAGRPGTVRHWLAYYSPVRGGDGQVIGVAAAVVDNTERRALLDGEREARQRADEAARAEREARMRADFLARAGVILDASLDYEETLANVARIAVPEVADWCAVSVLDADGVLHNVAVAHSDPAKEALGREFTARFPPDPRADSGPPAVARTGISEAVPEITDEMLVAALEDADELAMLRALGLRSSIVAPLIARERIFGTLALVSAESGRVLSEADVQLAEDLARRAGVAIDNARLYTERTRIAHTLQARLLPDRLPEIPRALLAARYRAAGELNEVGGDFYDVFPRSDTEWALVVGDVSGKGAEAAAITALARYTLRAAAMDEGPPSHALERLNTTMLADGSSLFATVVLAYVSSISAGALRVRVSLGGHPPPLILRADGRIEAVGVFGSVLGVMAKLSLTDTELRLGPADVMVLYTDGVTEAGPRSAPVGQQGLTALLATLAGQDPQRIVDCVEQAVVDAQVGEPRDDIALLALSVTGG